MGIESAIISALVTAAISAAASVGTSLLVSALQPKPRGIERRANVDDRVQSSEWNTPIPRLYGRWRNSGQVIWATPREERRTVTRGRGGKRATPDVTNISIYRSFAVKFGKGPVAKVVRIWFDTKLVYEGTAGGEISIAPKYCGGAKIYIGTETQMPDPWIEADKGVGRVSANRGDVVIVFHDVCLDEFGRIPNVLAEIVQDEACTLGQAVRAEGALAGLVAADFDTSLIETPLTGYSAGRQPARAALEEFALAYHFDYIEVDSRIACVPRGRAPEATVLWDDLGAHEEDAEAPPAIRRTRQQDLEIPIGVEVGYFDATRKWRPSKASYSRDIYDPEGVESISLRLAMTPVEASRCAKVHAVSRWTERTPFTFSLPPEYLRFTPGTVLSIPRSSELGAIHDTVRILKTDAGAPGAINITGVKQTSAAYRQTGDADVASGAVISRYEAEAATNTFSTTAVTEQLAGASGGTVVRLPQLGAGVGIPVQAARAGMHDLTIFYACAQSSLLAMKIGEALTHLQLPATGGVNTIGTITRRVELTPGANVVTFLNLYSVGFIVNPPIAKLDCIEVEPVIVSAVGGGGGGGFDSVDRIERPDSTRLWMRSLPRTTDADAGVPLYYVAGYPAGDDTEGAKWRGGDVFRDLDGDGELQHLATLTRPATTGLLLTALPVAAAGVNATATADVVLESGALASITQAAFAATDSVNLAVLDDGNYAETLQVRDCTDLGNSTYRLAYIRRGARGTTPRAFEPGTRFMLLDEAVKRVFINGDEVGKTFAHLGVSSGQTIDDALAVPFTIGGESAGPGPLGVGGDLAGDVDAATVTGLRGYDLAAGPLVEGQAYVFDGTAFAPKTISGELVPITSGAPAGVPSNAQAGFVVSRVDAVAGKVWYWVNNEWKSVTLS